jgi:NTP pyrophosphatase (non-canonical NTP hydrolase)
VLKPWVFENRREDINAYTEYENYIKNKKVANNKLEDKLKEIASDYDLPLKSFFTFFSGIYRNSYYKAEIDSILMHLSEEVGEATTELTRLQLIWLAPLGIFDKERIEEIKKCVDAKIDSKLSKIPEFGEKIKNRLSDLHNNLDYLVSNNQEIKNMIKNLYGIDFLINEGTSDEWVRLWFIVKISEKLKEELADIVSWIVAIACKLCERVKKDQDGLTIINELIDIYVSTKTIRPKPRCKSCDKPQCSNNCLVEHSCSNELVEHIMMM